MDWRTNKVLALAAAVVLVLGFGGGFLGAKAVDGGGQRATVDARGNPIPQTGMFDGWLSRFGHPRASNAPRAPLLKPAGFAVWRQRIETTGPNPRACVEFSRPLDPSKPYADYVLVSPDPGTPPAPMMGSAMNAAIVSGPSRWISSSRSFAMRSVNCSSVSPSCPPR